MWFGARDVPVFKGDLAWVQRVLVLVLSFGVEAAEDGQRSWLHSQFCTDVAVAALQHFSRNFQSPEGYWHDVEMARFAF